MGAPELIGATVVFAFNMAAWLLGSALSGTVRILQLVLDGFVALLSVVARVLGEMAGFAIRLLFGWLKKILDDIKKAMLLLEYEKLLKRKAALGNGLENDKEKLKEYANLIGELLGAGFERGKHRSARSQVGSFDVRTLARYEDVKRRALEYEQVVFRCFVVRQKLKLYDVDGRLNESKK